MNAHLNSAQNSLDNESGIRTITFLSQGIIDYPTALNENYTLLDSPVHAFRGGAKAINLPPQYTYNHNTHLMMYSCASVVDAEGKAFDFSNGKIKLREYTKNIDYPFPGRIDMTLDRGAVMTPPITYSVPAKITLWLLDQATMDALNILPAYQVKQWCSYGASYVPEETLVPVSEGGAARGYLSGDVWVGINTEYKGAAVRSVVGWNSSNPTYNDFKTAIAGGRTVGREVATLFRDVNGKAYYILRETFLQFNPDTWNP